MQIIVVLGVIAALIYYILKMRAGAKQNDEESDGAGEQGFMNNMFISSNSRAGSNSEREADISDADDKIDEDDEQKEHDESAPLLGDPYNDLEKLAALHEKGILTKEEYSAKKKDILDRI